MKYLKYFEDYDYDGEPVSNAYGIADDPIIKAIMANVHDITNITLFKPKNNIETENIRSELLHMNRDDFNTLFNYIFDVPYPRRS